MSRESAKKNDVRLTNIEAAKAVADAVRTSLGPRGMDKMVKRSLACAYYLTTPSGARMLHATCKHRVSNWTPTWASGGIVHMRHVAVAALVPLVNIMTSEAA